MHPHDVMKALPIRLLLIAGLWMPMVHSHAPEWREIALHGMRIGVEAAGGADHSGADHIGDVRHSVEPSHDHCPVCALQTMAPHVEISDAGILRSATCELQLQTDEQAPSQRLSSRPGRGPPHAA